MMEQTLINFIGQVGFPIFCAVYFMTRMEKHLTQTNKLLTIVAERLGVDENEVK